MNDGNFARALMFFDCMRSAWSPIARVRGALGHWPLNASRNRCFCRQVGASAGKWVFLPVLTAMPNRMILLD